MAYGGNTEDFVLSLQRTAGNQATSALLSGAAAGPVPVVQRLSVTPSDIDAVKGKTSGGFARKGQSSILAIRRKLAAYEKLKAASKPDEALDKTLTELDGLVTRWINSHRGAGLTDDERATRSLLIKLNDELPNERRDLSKKRAHDRYLSDASAGSRDLVPGAEWFAPTATPFKAMGSSRGFAAMARTKFEGRRISGEQEIAHEGKDTIKKARDARMKLVQDKGLTDAEHSAILTYTDAGGDFQYMNAAAANSPSWMAAIKKDRGGNATRHAKQDDKTLREEGSLHTAMASSGLAKLDPYPGVTYRGESMTQGQFWTRAKVGGVAKFPNLSSSSKLAGKALGFALENTDSRKKIVVIWAFSNAGGRDIEALSALSGEGEVLFLPGTTFTTKSVTRVGSPSGASDAGSHSDMYNLMADRMKQFPQLKAYLVQVEPQTPGKEPPSSGKEAPAAQWSAAKSASAANQFALPTNVDLMGLDRARGSRRRPRG